MLKEKAIFYVISWTSPRISHNFSNEEHVFLLSHLKFNSNSEFLHNENSLWLSVTLVPSYSVGQCSCRNTARSRSPSQTPTIPTILSCPIPFWNQNPSSNPKAVCLKTHHPFLCIFILSLSYFAFCMGDFDLIEHFVSSPVLFFRWFEFSFDGCAWVLKYFV